MKLDEAIEALAAQDELQRGAVFTRGFVVEAILDLVGYTADRKLQSTRLLEPAAGRGDFLLPAVERLLSSFVERGGRLVDAHEQLGDAIRAVEIHEASFEELRGRLLALLTSWGLAGPRAEGLLKRWLIRADFLLHPFALESFDMVVGNPPYVRQERIPELLLREYRRRYATLYDRADLYVPFFERGLELLSGEGKLGFVCADRWLKNKYGGPLREKIAGAHRVECFVALHHIDAFAREVLAYPGIIVVGQGEGATRVPAFDPHTPEQLRELVEALLAEAPGGQVVQLEAIGSKRDPWLLDAPGILPVLRELEATFPTLEEAGCKVGIGVATGCDRVFIGDFAALPVEAERKLPLLKASDLKGGALEWGGEGIVNPFLESGALASFEAFPAFGRYMEQHREALEARYVARKYPSRWYRTIDRIAPELLSQPKLLIPDIKADAVVVYDDGQYYPHHNLYVITATGWDLRGLQGLLRSSIAQLFVAAYSLRMAGGFLRFQAQYLRRIRVPSWQGLGEQARAALVDVALSPREAVDQVVFPLYGLGHHQAEEIAAFLDRP